MTISQTMLCIIFTPTNPSAFIDLFYLLDLSVPVVFERITTQFSIFHEEQLLGQKVSSNILISVWTMINCTPKLIGFNHEYCWSQEESKAEGSCSTYWNYSTHKTNSTGEVSINHINTKEIYTFDLSYHFILETFGMIWNWSFIQPM